MGSAALPNYPEGCIGAYSVSCLFLPHSQPGRERSDIQVSFTPESYPGGVWAGLDRFPGATMACWQQRPYSRGHVLIKSPNFRDAPEIQPNYLDDERDQTAIVKAIKLARKIAAAPPVARYIGQSAGRERIARQMHICGTCPKYREFNPSLGPNLQDESSMGSHGGCQPGIEFAWP